MNAMARWLMKTGVLLILAGIALRWVRRAGFLRFVGHMPGDVGWKAGSMRLRVPLGSWALALLVLLVYANARKRR